VGTTSGSTFTRKGKLWVTIRGYLRHTREHLLYGVKREKKRKGGNWRRDKDRIKDRGYIDPIS